MTPIGRASLLEAQDRFIAAWGQMGSAWGISRTMAEAHALLYITGEPLCSDDVMARLEISRGNASMSLRALLDWGLVAKTHKRGDRKEYFVAEQDVWAMARAVLRQRLKREVEPLVASLHEVRDMASGPASAPEETPESRVSHQVRIENLLGIFELVMDVTSRFADPSGEGLEAAAMLLGAAGEEPRA